MSLGQGRVAERSEGAGGGRPQPFLQSSRMLLPARSDAAGGASSRAIESVRAIAPETWILGCVVAIGALLRFSTLGAQSYWFDEAQAAHEFTLSFGGMVSAMIARETNPPLYFVLGWLWVKVFGSGPVGLRALSALAGTAAIAIAYLSGRELVSKSAGIVAALLAAVSPFMIWYSQEAREYMLLAALSGASFLFFARTLRAPSTKNIAWWGVFSGLALLTQFFAGFLVGPEAVWLLYAVRRRAVLTASVVLALIELALTPLLFTHATKSLLGFITQTPLRLRIEQVPVAFALGTLANSSLVNYGLLAAAVVAGVLIVLLLIGAGSEQLRGAGVAALVAAGVLLIPLLLAVLGHDYYIYRALIPAWIPLAVVVGAACTARRTLVPGIAFVVIALAGFVYAQVQIDNHAQYQRPDWRGVATALGRTDVARAIVVYNGGLATDPLEYYLPGARWGFPPQASLSVGEVDVVASIYQPNPRALPRGVKLLGQRSVSDYVVDRFRVSPAWNVTSGDVAARAAQLASPAPPERDVVIQIPTRP